MAGKEDLVVTLFPNNLTEEQLTEAIIAFLREEGIEVTEDDAEGEEEDESLD